MTGQNITPFLWLDGKAEAAATLYISLFENSRLGNISRYGSEGADIHRQPVGQAMVVEMELAGCKINALNGGPMFKINPSISFFVQLKTEDEVAALWNGLVEGGEVMMAMDTYPWSPRYGWLKDRFGVSWQIALATRDFSQTITPFLLFTGEQAGKAEEAINLYTSLFENSKIEAILRHDGTAGQVKGTIQHAQFCLNGEMFMAMDSAFDHGFGFNEGLSLMVSCDSQQQVDHLWTALIADGGAVGNCGWLKDRFGLSWQIIPKALFRLLSHPDRAAAGRVMNAMLGMHKLDIAALEAAGKAA